jgi:hypothetical protein
MVDGTMGTKTGLILVVVATSGLMAGCAESNDARSAPQSVVRDSAGVTIVDNEMPQPDSRLTWSISADPTLSIGTLEGEEAYQLFRVSDAMRLDDGRIVVVNGGSNEMRVFDAAGVHLASWGGEGEGPGEFTGTIEIDAWAGDSIMAFDFRQRRISVYGLDGVHGRTFALHDNEDLVAPQFRGILSNGRLLVRSGAIFTAGEIGEGLMRFDYEHATISPEGEDAQSFGAFPGTEAFVIASPGSMSVFTHPFGRNTLNTPWGDGVVVSPTDTYELKVFDAEGMPTRIIRRDHLASSPTLNQLKAYFQEQYADSDPAERAQEMERVSEMPLVDAFPAYADVKSDPLGHLWVQEYQLPGDEQVIWTVFDREGRVLGFVETPSDLEVFEIGADYILGRTRDDFDVEYVQRWDLTR